MSDAATFEAVQDAIADSLACTYDCTRVWEAWFVGTMSEQDFILVTDDPERLHEITTAVIAAMPAPTVKPLVWTETSGGFSASIGQCGFYIMTLSPTAYRVYGISGDSDGSAEFGTLSEAKNSAQLQHNREILFALGDAA